MTAVAAAVALALTFTFPAEIGDSFFGFGNAIVANAAVTDISVTDGDALISLSPTTHNYRNIDKNKQKWYNRSARKKAEKSKKACT